MENIRDKWIRRACEVFLRAFRYFDTLHLTRVRVEMFKLSKGERKAMLPISSIPVRVMVLSSRPRKWFQLFFVFIVVAVGFSVVSSLVFDYHVSVNFREREVAIIHRDEKIFVRPLGDVPYWNPGGLKEDELVHLVQPSRNLTDHFRGTYPHKQYFSLTSLFKDNLDPSRKYVTSFVSAGFTNQLIALLHLIQISLHTRSIAESGNQNHPIRIPVLPPFAPAAHMTSKAGYFHFGDIFDVPRLSSDLKLDILEWRDLKNVPETNDGPMDKLGCWSLIFSQFPNSKPKDGMPNWPWHGEVPRFLGLDTSWTPVPTKDLIQYTPDGAGFPADLAKLSFLGDGESREEAIKSVNRAPTIAKGSKERVPPDEQMLCFDFLFYSAFDDVSVSFSSGHLS